MSEYDEYLERFRLSPFGQLAPREWDEQVTMPEWALHNLIPKHSIGMLYGANNSGKSHLVCDLAISMRNGHRQWQGHDLAAGPVVMFSESHGHIKARLKAYINHCGGSKAHPIYTYPTMSLNVDDIEFLGAWLYMLPSPPVMVVFDTLSTSFQLEENDNKEAAKLMKMLEKHVMPALDPLGFILIVHHTSKISEGRSARGASALVDNIDFSINVQWDKEIERTIAKWEKDRWRLIDQSPQWAGDPHRVEVDFTNGSTEMMVLEWSEYSDEAKELAKELQKDLQLAEWKELVKPMIKPGDYFHTNGRCRPPKGYEAFALPKVIPTKNHPAIREWIAANWENEPVFTLKGAECGFKIKAQ